MYATFVEMTSFERRRADYLSDEGSQFWMFLIYDKDEMTDLTADQKKLFRKALTQEIDARKPS